ncbi:MAG: hypothetical protein JWP57_4015 [Spirosoma sp.]|nr:hypothetical protein [Spirosoma sp.]
MCEPVTIIAGVGLAISAAGAVAAHQSAEASSSASASAGVSGQIANMRDRSATIAYQNQTYAQDIQYANDMLEWSKQEWDRQLVYHSEATKAVEKNTLAQVAQVMLRQVEEDMSTILQGTEVRKQGTVVRASIRARSGDRGVEGNSVDAILDDVTRQEGEVLTVQDMNRSATQRQLNREAIALDAQGDQNLANLSVKTFAPSTQIRTPGTTASVQQAAPVMGPSTAVLTANLAGSVGSAVSNYSVMSGQKVSDTVNDIGKWAGRQFIIPPGAGG